MKKYCYILAVFIISSASKCDKTNCEITNDCFPEREIVKTLELQKGAIKEVVKGIFAIVPEEGSGRYQACNMDTDLCVEGLKVKFCGIEKATLPNERRAASPFVLGHIEKAE